MDHSLTGEPLAFRPPSMEKADILAFSSAFDPQPAHVDEVAARDTPLCGLAASGWHTCAVAWQALEAAMAGTPGYLGIAGIDELRWLRPVRPGDELRGAITLGAPAPCTCGSSVERRQASVDIRNRLGESVLHWSSDVLFGSRRPRTPIAPYTFQSRRPSRVTLRPGEHFIKYFEDVHCGDELALGSYTFDPGNVGLFERIVAAKGNEAPCRNRADVKEWNVVAAWMRLTVAYYQDRAAALAAAGLPVPRLGPAAGLKWLRWLAPVSLGQRVRFRTWAEHKVGAPTSSQWGLLVAGTEGYNDAGELVISFYPQFLLERRPATPSAGAGGAG